MAFVYSCCFWFSLRLGGILIGFFSVALLLLIMWGLVYAHPQPVTEAMSEWLKTLDLGYYSKSFIVSVQTDPQSSASLAMTLTCIYIVISLLFIYGAYKCNTVLMTAYIVMEAVRLLALSAIVANCLLLLKRNTMDIGLLIGASVAAGFLLLGQFYLWICTVNLPIVINELRLDEQAAMIHKLQQQLGHDKPRSITNAVINTNYNTDYGTPNNMFVITSNRFIDRHI